MQIFFAHASSCTIPELRHKIKGLREHIQGKSSVEAHVVAGRLDHQKNWRGNWDSWTYGVVSRKNAVTGKYVYDAFVVERPTCGKATASILLEALRLGRAVFYWDSEQLLRVLDVGEGDPNDWTGGWNIVWGRGEE